MSEYVFFYHIIADSVDNSFECKSIDLDGAFNHFLNHLLSCSDFDIGKYHIPPFCLEDGLYRYYSDKDIKHFLFLLSTVLEEKEGIV